MKLLILTQKVDEGDDNLGFFCRWIAEFAARCESVLIICLYEGTHSLPANVRVLSLGKEAGVSRLKYLRRFYSYICKERANYDAVFVHMNQVYVILGGLLWRLWGKRIGLWYAHGAVPFSLRIATFLSHIIFTSTPEGFRIATTKKKIVGQGIDAALFAQKNNYALGDTVRLVTAGRISRAKNIEGMLDLVAALERRGLAATLDIIGSGDETYVGHLKALAAKRGLAKKIIFKGGMAYKELAKALSGYDVFVNMGMTGSLDKAVLDAAAAGLPVVTTNRAFDAFAVEHAERAVERLCRTSSEERRAAAGMRAWVMREHALAALVRRIMRSMKA